MLHNRQTISALGYCCPSILVARISQCTLVADKAVAVVAAAAVGCADCSTSIAAAAAVADTIAADGGDCGDESGLQRRGADGVGVGQRDRAGLRLTDWCSPCRAADDADKCLERLGAAAVAADVDDGGDGDDIVAAEGQLLSAPADGASGDYDGDDVEAAAAAVSDVADELPC